MSKKIEEKWPLDSFWQLGKEVVCVVGYASPLAGDVAVGESTEGTHLVRLNLRGDYKPADRAAFVERFNRTHHKSDWLEVDDGG